MNETPPVEPLTRDQVLDQLAFLAEVEHALIVEYLPRMPGDASNKALARCGLLPAFTL